MKKMFLSCVLSAFLVLPGKAQVNSSYNNRLLKEFAQSKPDSTRIDYFLQLANYYFDKTDLVNHLDSTAFYLKEAQQMNESFPRVDLKNRTALLSARLYCKQHPDADVKKIFLAVIDSFKRSGDLLREQETWVELGMRTELDQQPSAFKITCYQNALLLARQRNDKDAEMSISRDIADFHLQQQQFELSERELFQILKEEKKIRPHHILFTYDLLTALYTQKSDFNKALVYAFKTQKMMETTGDSAYAFTFHTRLSDIYMLLNKPTEAIKWQKKALNNAIYTNATGFFSAVSSIVDILLKERKAQEALRFLQQQVAKRKPTEIEHQRMVQKALGNCYDSLQRYEQAETNYLERIRLGNAPSFNYFDEAKAYDNFLVGGLHKKFKSYHKAHQYLEASLKIYEKLGIIQNISYIDLWLFEIDSLLGDHVEAIQHLQQSNRLADSIHTLLTNKQLEELQIAYKTDEKDKSIKFLETKGKLDQVQLQYARSVRNWIIAGASMLLIIAGLLYRQARVRKKNNKIIKHKNEQLQHLVTEKEWLLKEVHHRVKNNLHTVIGLLESQAAYLEDDALKANEISKHRIYAMSLIHQQLYKAEDIKTIDMSVYLPELVDYLSESFGTERHILFQLDIEALKLGVSQAIPIALIVNEAVTNSIKYAFPSGKPGTIRVSMHQTGEQIKLVIADDGIGIDPAITEAESTSLGLKLMKGLSEDIEGAIRFTNDKGTRIVVSFSPDALNEPTGFSQ